MHGVIEVPPLSLVSGTSFPFFRFHKISVNPDPLKKPDRIIGWSHPTLLNLLRYHSTDLFVDGTFRCVPHGFEQCVIVMVMDEGTDLFLPVFFALMTRRTQDLYHELWPSLYQETDEKLRPASLSCDFEGAMISSLQIQFPNAEIIGCQFHFKQAVGRKLHRVGIPVPERKIAMTKSVLDILIVIDHDLIDKSGIPWGQSKVKYLCREARIRYSKEPWTAFWTYFRRTWLHRYPPTLWNVHGLENALVARTNNPLERFNRTMDDAFAAPLPSLTSFVTTINELSIDFVNRYQDTVNERSMGRLKAKKRLPPRIDLPDEPDLFSIRVDDTDELSDDADGMVGHDDSADGDTGQEPVIMVTSTMTATVTTIASPGPRLCLSTT